MNTPTPSETLSNLPRPVATPPALPAASLPDQTRPAGGGLGQVPLAAMDPAVKSIQPSGGVAMSLELAWGRLRRAYLRKFRPGYVARMADRRQGERGDLPIDPVDARDLKYYRNQGCYWWADADDPFLWRDSLPLMRVGLAELIIFGSCLLVLSLTLALLWWPLGLPPLLAFGLLLWFFRNPRRAVPCGSGTVVAPADGRLLELLQVDDPVIGPALQFVVKLSILNVYANRASLPGRVVAVRYQRGRMLNALRPKSDRQKERLDLELAATDLGGQVIRIRQVTGKIARRIVCWARVGDVFERGEMYGMIKLGSRTELIIPRLPGLEIQARAGDKLMAGTTVLARYQTAAPTPSLSPSTSAHAPAVDHS